MIVVAFLAGHILEKASSWKDVVLFLPPLAAGSADSHFWPEESGLGAGSLKHCE